MSQDKANQSQFLNVDLDIFSKRDLQPLVDALDPKVIVLHVGKHKRTYETHLELAYYHTGRRSPDAAIRRFCKLIQELPPAAREIWDGAKIRQFDIGTGPTNGSNYWAFIASETLRAAAEINARISVTVYRCDMETLSPNEKEKQL